MQRELQASTREERSVLPPREMYLFSFQETPFLSRLNNIPGQMGIFYLMTRLARWSKPRWPAPVRWLLAGIWYGLFVAADTLHSVGHVISARQAGAPMDSVIWAYGLQFNKYYNRDVSPQQHIGRAVGGPAISGVLALTAYWLWRKVQRVPVLGDIAQAWFVCNALVLGASLTPLPLFDGGVILREAVKLRTGEEALGEEAVQQAAFAVAGGLLLAAFVMLLRRRLLVALSLIGFATFIVIDRLFLSSK